MSTSARRRLMRDFRKLSSDPPAGVTGSPLDTNIMVWQAVILGPDDTPWEGGTFNLVLEFTEEYPNKAPKVRFVTKMFHPNIYADGQICLDILQSQWSPIYDVAAVLTSIQSLLCDPNPASPANQEAARLYEENRREYNKRVKAAVEKSWADSEGEDEGDSSDSDSDSSDSDSDSEGEGAGDDTAGGAGGGAGVVAKPATAATGTTATTATAATASSAAPAPAPAPAPAAAAAT